MCACTVVCLPYVDRNVQFPRFCGQMQKSFDQSESKPAATQPHFPFADGQQHMCTHTTHKHTTYVWSGDMQSKSAPGRIWRHLSSATAHTYIPQSRGNNEDVGELWGWQTDSRKLSCLKIWPNEPQSTLIRTPARPRPNLACACLYLCARSASLSLVSTGLK